MTLDEFYGVLYDPMAGLTTQSLIRLQGIREQFGSRFDVFPYETLQRTLLSSFDPGCPGVAFPLQ